MDIYALCAFLCAEITFFNMRWQRLTHIGSVETNGIEDCCWFFLFGFLDLVYIFSKTYNFVSKKSSVLILPILWEYTISKGRSTLSKLDEILLDELLNWLISSNRTNRQATGNKFNSSCLSFWYIYITLCLGELMLGVTIIRWMNWNIILHATWKCEIYTKILKKITKMFCCFFF